MAIDGWRRIGMRGGLFDRAGTRELGRAIAPEEAELLRLRHGELFRELLSLQSRCPRLTKTCRRLPGADH